MTSRSGLVSMTQGMSRAFSKDRKMVRACSRCDTKMPSYPGRYPGKCPHCGACVEMIECWSSIPRLQRLLECGEALEGDVVLPYELIEANLSFGLAELGFFTLQGLQENVRYREESKEGPVLLFEFHDDRSVCVVSLVEKTSVGYDLETRNSAFRPATIGQGAKRVVGGFRFQIGKNRRYQPRKDIAMSIRNRRNARRGLAKRIKAAKKWHQSAQGRKYHRDLGRYNLMSDSEESTATRDRLRDKMMRLKDGDIQEAYQPQNVYHTAPPTIDDVFDEVMRKLIFAESLDVLEDVNFGEDGSIYLFFDPQLTRVEIDEIVSGIKTGHGDAQLIASPDGSLPEESAASDWWVAFLPGKTDENGGYNAPNPAKYARKWDKSQPTKRIVQNTVTDIDRASLSINTNALFKNLGERKMRDDARRWLNL